MELIKYSFLYSTVSLQYTPPVMCPRGQRGQQKHSNPVHCTLTCYRYSSRDGRYYANCTNLDL